MFVALRGSGPDQLLAAEIVRQDVKSLTVHFAECKCSLRILLFSEGKAKGDRAVNIAKPVIALILVRDLYSGIVNPPDFTKHKVQRTQGGYDGEFNASHHGGVGQSKNQSELN